MREKDGERAATRIMRAKLGDGERLDDLGIKGYQIIQKKDGFCFGMDAVLLSSFVKVKKNGNVLDSWHRNWDSSDPHGSQDARKTFYRAGNPE